MNEPQTLRLGYEIGSDRYYLVSADGLEKVYLASSYTAMINEMIKPEGQRFPAGNGQRDYAEHMVRMFYD